MGKLRGLLTAFFGTLVLASGASAEQTLRWETTIDGAKQAARQSDRLVMIIFSAPWCQACRAMEAEVLSQPGTASALEANFVPVKVNVEYFPAAARQYGITGLPTTVIITPTAQGEVLDSIRGRMPLAPYITRLNQVAAESRRRSLAVSAQIPAGTTGSAASPTDRAATSPPASPAAATNPPASSSASDTLRPATQAIAPGTVVMGTPQPVVQAVSPSAPTDPSQGNPAGADRPVAAASGNVLRASPAASTPVTPGPVPPPPPAAPVAGTGDPPAGFAGPSAVAPSQASLPLRPAASGPPPATPPQQPGNPPLGLDGFCPVQLTEKGTWTPGNRRWGAIHRGRTYLFVGPDEQHRFLADPDRFAPVNSGEDIVVALEQGRSVVGNRAHGVFFGGKIYLFADEVSLDRFSKNPKYYAERALQAMRPAEASSQVR